MGFESSGVHWRHAGYACVGSPRTVSDDPAWSPENYRRGFDNSPRCRRDERGRAHDLPLSLLKIVPDLLRVPAIMVVRGDRYVG